MEIGNDKIFPLPKDLGDILENLWEQLNKIIK